jgi:hypothetical protein
MAMVTDTPRDDCRATADGGAALCKGDKTVGHVKPRSAEGWTCEFDGQPVGEVSKSLAEAKAQLSKIAHDTQTFKQMGMDDWGKLAQQNPDRD